MTPARTNKQDKSKESVSGIFAFYAHDHEEIDVLFSKLRADTHAAAQAARGSTAGLGACFDAFDARLERHIRWEEEILFPAVEEKQPGLAAGPGRVMRMEHEEIRRLKAIAGEILHAPAPLPAGLAQAAAALDQMFEVLVEHNGKEENVYYPLSDEILSPAEREDLLARTRASR